jgi:hypothetical protein
MGIVTFVAGPSYAIRGMIEIKDSDDIGLGIDDDADAVGSFFFFLLFLLLSTAKHGGTLTVVVVVTAAAATTTTPFTNL